MLLKAKQLWARHRCKHAFVPVGETTTLVAPAPLTGIEKHWREVEAVERLTASAKKRLAVASLLTAIAEKEQELAPLRNQLYSVAPEYGMASTASDARYANEVQHAIHNAITYLAGGAIGAGMAKYSDDSTKSS